MSGQWSDIRLVDGDVVFTRDGDLATVLGPECVAQDIAVGAQTARGAIPWDAAAGSDLPLLLNDAGARTSTIVASLEKLAIDDPRVDPASVHADVGDAGRIRLRFRTIGGDAYDTVVDASTQGVADV